MNLLPNDHPDSPAYIDPVDLLCIELRSMVSSVLNSRRIEVFAIDVGETFSSEAIGGINAYANKFHKSVERLFEASKIIWKRQEIAIDVYQELFALEEASRFLTLDIEIEFGDPEYQAFNQQLARTNLSVLKHACCEMPTRLLRLAFRLEAYSFVVGSSTIEEATELHSRKPTKALPAVQVQLLKMLGSSDGTVKETLQKLADDIRCGKGTVSKHITDLKTAGFVQSVEGGGHCLSDAGRSRLHLMARTDQN